MDSTPRIPGIDSVDLMERIGEDVRLFWDVLGDFSSLYRASPGEIAAALERDPHEAKTLSHTLKGVLGNLGAKDLFVTCKALDDAIREGQTGLYPGLLATLSREVPALCDAIDRARADLVAPEHAGPAIDADWLDERYASLRLALAGHRARDCKALADEIAAAVLPEAEQSFFASLHALVRSYRFKDAQALLERRLDD